MEARIGVEIVGHTGDTQGTEADSTRVVEDYMGVAKMQGPTISHSLNKE